MATITAQAKLGIATAEAGTPTANRSASITQSGTDYVFGSQTINTTATAISIGDCADRRYVWVALPSTTTQTVTVTMSAVEIRPGDVMLLPNAGSAVTMQATGAAVVQKAIVES